MSITTECDRMSMRRRPLADERTSGQTQTSSAVSHSHGLGRPAWNVSRCLDGYCWPEGMSTPCGGTHPTGSGVSSSSDVLAVRAPYPP